MIALPASETESPLKQPLALMIVALLLGACAAAPARPFEQGRLLAGYDFAEPGSFETGFYPDATLQVRDGVYRIDVSRGDGEVWWGQGGEPSSDVIIEVVAQQTSARPESAYGVMCRVGGGAETADAPPGIESGDGYLFLVQGSGAFAILRSRGRDITALVEWTPSGGILTGAGAQNRLRVVCLGDYLAFYINDTFMGAATDRTYTSGQVGLAASASNRLGAQIQFDNLNIYEALPG
jgi:hypothetical protein